MKKTLIAILLSLSLMPLCYAQATQSTEPETAIAPEPGTQQVTPPEPEQRTFTITPANKNTIKPNQILVEMKPGDYYENSIIAENYNNFEIALHLNASDAASSEKEVSAKDDNAPQNNIGLWTRFTESEITIAPRGKKEIKFMILIPKKTRPDVYKGGLTAVYLVPSSEADTVQFALRYLIGTTVTVTNDPQPVPMQSKPGLANIFTSGSPYFWGSVGLFVVGMGYFIYGSMQEKKKKKINKKS